MAINFIKETPSNKLNAIAIPVYLHSVRSDDLSDSGFNSTISNSLTRIDQSSCVAMPRVIEMPNHEPLRRWSYGTS